MIRARALLRTRQPVVTIIIVHYRGLEILRNCLESVFNTTYENFRVILVDNGSDDGSIEYVQKVYSDRVRVIRSEVNLGFVAGNNLALRQAKGDYVILLNDDTIVEPDWLEKLVEVAESDPSIGACQPKLVSLTDPRYFEYNGAAGGMLDVYGVPLARGRVFDLIEEDRGQYDTTMEVFWASGAAMLIKSRVLMDAGLLDDVFYAHMEEIDLCWRIRLLGYRIICVPKSIVYHLGGGTPLGAKFYLKHRNNLIVMLKNYSGINLLRFFTLRMALDAMSFLYFLVRRKNDRSLCIPRAYLWLLKKFGKIYSGRCRVQRRRRTSDKEIIAAMISKSVAIQHFLMKRRLLSELCGLPYALNRYKVDQRDVRKYTEKYAEGMLGHKRDDGVKSFSG